MIALIIGSCAGGSNIRRGTSSRPSSLWIVLVRSGVHATIAGVTLGAADADAHPFRAADPHRVGARVHPWSSFVVLPLFALAERGHRDHAASASASRSRARSRSGSSLGLVVGKVVGISGGSWLALRFGGRPACGRGRREIVAVGLLGGIGFTVSLFVAGLSFSGPDLVIAKLAILAASLIAAAAAWFVLRTIRAVSPSET